MGKLRIEAELCQAVNFALQQNGAKIIPSVTLYNEGDADEKNMILQIRPELPVFLPWRVGVDRIPAGGSLRLRAPELSLSADYLAGLTEKVSCRVEFRLSPDRASRQPAVPAPAVESAAEAEPAPAAEAEPAPETEAEPAPAAEAEAAPVAEAEAAPVAELEAAEQAPETEAALPAAPEEDTAPAPEENTVLCREISVLAYDEWQGAQAFPEILAAYVMPNHPVLLPILKKAAEILSAWTGKPQLDGYQSGDRNRVRYMAAAVYEAIRQEQILYAVVPEGFEETGQRVRLPESVLQNRMGNCLDLSLLYAGCLEAMGLHPLLILQSGHIFAGVWLTEESFSEAVTEDGSLLEKRLSDGLQELTVVECTLMTSGGGEISFETAEQKAVEELADYGKFLYCLDVFRSRRSGIRPMPLRVMTEGGYQIQDGAGYRRGTGNETSDSAQEEGGGLVSAPELLSGSFSFEEALEREPVTKLVSWERKLLDLTARNMLIHLRLTQSVVPLLSGSVADLEDTLATGEELKLLPRPNEFDRVECERTPFTQENTNDLGGFEDLIRAECAAGRLHTVLGEKELEKALTRLYRTAKASLEENGASTLFLAVGLLRWYESRTSSVPRYAPILLLPVELVRKSASRGYILRQRDDEPQLNITIFELLKQAYGIVVQGLDPLPRDEKGLDIRRIFAAVRHACLGEPRWNVIESGFVSNFSFSQFVMWNDIHSRAEFLSQSPVVRSLMEGRLEPEIAAQSEGAGADRDRDAEGRAAEAKASGSGDIESGASGSEAGGELLLPLAADESQLGAVRMAAEGKSFVLHGPPGTGKSQTITAMIANAIVRGRTVLFVAEKMAALTVVEKRLNALGLDPFCLELHSNRATRKSVLSQLKKALEVQKTLSDGAWKQKTREINALRGELDAYAEGLHQKHLCGLSLREMLDRWEEYRQFPEFSLGEVDADGITARELEEQRALVQQLLAAGRGVGHPSGHPLRLVGRTRYDQQLKQDIPEAAASYLAAARESRAAMQRFAEQTGIGRLSENQTVFGKAGSDRAGSNSVASDNSASNSASSGGAASSSAAPESADLRERLLAAAAELPDPSGIPEALLREKAPEPLFGALSQYFNEAEALEERREALLALWSPDFLRLDMGAFEQEYKEAEKKLLPFMKSRAMGILTDRLQSYARQPVDTQRIPALLTSVRLFQEEEKALAARRDGLPGAARELLAQFPDRGALEGLRQRYDALSRAAGRFPCFENRLPEPAEAEQLRRSAESFLRAEEKERQAEGAVLEMLRPWKWRSLELSEREAFLETVCGHLNELKDWVVYQQAVERCAYAGLTPVLSRYEEGEPHETLYGAFCRSLWEALARSVIGRDEALNSFTGASFAEKVQRFRRLDREQMECARQEIYCRLSERLPQDRESGEISAQLGILRRAIRSNGRGLTIRSLFEQIPDILPRLCPCMLMSPISVSQYLKAENRPADLVIFDEASQLPTCKAVGVLARGRNAVIVGDPNQMPPTSFFAGSMIDEDNLDIEDLDSILDDCLALGMPETHLRWHYRSRHESLIAFSNSEFYENSMMTFPSGNDRQKRVQLVRVEGFFDRGRTRQNRAEAEAIVAEILRRYQDPAAREQSLGVVTFNVNQQTLVEDLLQEQFRADPEFDSWANESQEPLFVKNLENVQGDERDVVLFSVAFGPDETGKMSMNFGPINQQNGWKRLNVAVTRARQEMLVFTVMRPEMISLTRTSARGVEALRDFLVFAETGRLPFGGGEQERGAGRVGGILQTLCQRLTEAGYEYQTQVGHSEFRVDLAVADPEDPENYLLGVLLDAESYGRARCTRDRELSEPDVLSGLGWKLHRIYAMDWWDDREKEWERLLARLLEVKKEKYGICLESEQSSTSLPSSQEESWDSSSEDS